MRRLSVYLWIITIAAALAGCSSQAGRQFVHQGELAMTERFDFASVDAFLRRVTIAHPQVDEVRLASLLVRGGWYMAESDYPWRMRSGGWVLDDRGRKNEFCIYYDLPHERVIVIKTKRISRSEFELVSVERAFLTRTELGTGGRTSGQSATPVDRPPSKQSPPPGVAHP